MTTTKMSLSSEVAKPRRNKLLSRMSQHTWHYIFVTPMLILFGMFTLWPMAGSIYYSFFNWDGVGAPTKFIGLGNFKEIIIDPYYWNAFKNNYIFAFSQVAIQYPLALILAMILNNILLKGRNVYRLFIFLPVITTTAVIGLVFTLLLHPVGGAISAFLKMVGMEPINFLGNPKLALSTAIAVAIWKNIGITIIYWLAALQTVPAELYEAAKIDGATRTKALIHITIPLIAPIGSVILLLTFIGSLHPFDLIKTLTNGGPMYTTDVVDTYVYRYAFSPESNLPRYGFASAAGFLFGVTVMLITLLQAPVLKKVGQYR
ncbi:carbohydrate ABC transporter membrane protein 1, CUT1 family (TC 3.A.1.1.-) [Paenibacillus sp. 1_12]|uniref:carbohydrate ABC transporter permease n=1 Tax=Paenibacillus sp. 1_12 TaxID=1566278 RepID=UPI0008E1872A|nr:sugar ABC transporter permease [Paenibacillus sp. 1_12]SFM44551.1 carbohydrate ABC transporter membrane protein 1, CUT1 family (TC 3.A.1.1.-) [Paenibacillus sp. 1_12]